MVGAAALFGSGVVDRQASGASASTSLPAPAASGIDHIVVVMMENRSFDHFLGWLPGADGKQAGLTLHRPVRRTAPHVPPDRVRQLRLRRPRPLLRGRPDRAATTARATAGSRPGRERRAGRSATYQQPDLPFLGAAAPALDEPATATSRPRWPRRIPNRFYQHAAQTDRLHNSTHDLDAADDLGPARRSRADRPLLLLRRPVHRAVGDEVPRHLPSRSRRFLADAATGTVARRSASSTRVSRTRTSGTSNDDHPHCGHPSRRGLPEPGLHSGDDQPELGATRCWSSTSTNGAGSSTTSHPARAPDVSAATALRGFRVPALVISPRARRGHVDHTRLRPHLGAASDRMALGARAADAARCRRRATSSRRSTSPRRRISPRRRSPCRQFVAAACPGDAAPADEAGEWVDLKEVAISLGWSLPA